MEIFKINLSENDKNIALYRAIRKELEYKY